MNYPHKIILEKVNEDTEDWEPYAILRATPNIQRSNEMQEGGGTAALLRIKFNVRYISKLNEVFNNTQLFRIKFNERYFNIKGFDNYFLRNKNVALIGEVVE